MLKHCSPSAVDLRRRSRRTLSDLHGDRDLALPTSVAPDALSLQSSSGGSSTAEEPAPAGASPELLARLSPLPATTPAPASSDPAVFQDASTSPPGSPFRLRRVPLSLLAARQRSLCRQQSSLASTTGTTAEASTPTKMPIKVYAKCLCSDIEYKTLSVGSSMTAREVIWLLLSKYRMRHRDPRLFYLTMDLNIKRTGIPLRRSLSLDDDSRPVELKSCHPWGECKFTLQMRKGGVVRVYDSVLMAESRYKCLLISEETTAAEVVRILFHCYNLERVERVERYCICEETSANGQKRERRLRMDEKPVLVQASWLDALAASCKLVLRLAPLEDKESDEKKTGEELEEDMLMDTSDCGCSSGGEGGESTTTGSNGGSESEFSALRYRDSPVSGSTRSSTSTDSGLKSSPETNSVTFLKHQTRSQPPILRQVSLHSLLEALPAASVDDGAPMDPRSRRASLSSISLESRSSDYDSYFYI